MSDDRGLARADVEIARAVLAEARRRRAAGQGGVSDVHLAELRFHRALERAQAVGALGPDDDPPEAA